jgi:hypothetical protein
MIDEAHAFIDEISSRLTNFFMGDDESASRMKNIIQRILKSIFEVILFGSAIAIGATAGAGIGCCVSIIGALPGAIIGGAAGGLTYVFDRVQ